MTTYPRSLARVAPFALLLPLGLFAGGAGAATLTVDTLADPGVTDTQCTLREAVISANTNTDTGGCVADTSTMDYGDDTIVFAAALFAGAGPAEPPTIFLQGGEIGIASTLTIDGSDPTEGSTLRMFIDANGTDDMPSASESRIFNITAGTTTLNRIVLVGGRSAADGGGVLVAAGAALMADTITMTDNEAAGDGGAIYTAGTVEIRGSGINGNTALGNGGAIAAEGASSSIRIEFATNLQGNRAGSLVPEDPMAEVSPLVPEVGAPAGNGGALYVGADASLTIAPDFDGFATIFLGNTATGSGGAIWSAGTTSISNARLDGSRAFAVEGGGGGLIYNTGDLEIVLSTLSNASAANVDDSAGSGGAILSEGGSLSLDFCRLVGNFAVANGGGIALTGGADATLTSTAIESNGIDVRAGANGEAVPILTQRGGGLYVDNTSTLTLETVSISRNLAGVSGGGIWNAGTTEAKLIDVLRNEGQGDAAEHGGGGIYNEGMLTLSGSRLLINAAPGEAGSGGALFNAGGSATLTAVDINRNSAVRAGGAIEVTAGTVALVNVTLGGDDPEDANVAGDNPLSDAVEVPNPGYGGAVHVTGGVVTIEGSTIAFNDAIQGGGLWNSAAGSLTVTNTTISNNEAIGGDAVMADNGDGGGVYQLAGGTTTLAYTTVTQNRADDDGGGLAVGGAPAAGIVLQASIVANNFADDLGDNFVDDGRVAFGPDSTVAADAGLAPLQLYGGPTATHRLLETSPALDIAGCNVMLDQRDVPRPFDIPGTGSMGCDAGAFERDTTLPRVVVTANGPEVVGVGIGADVIALAFSLRNTEETNVVIGGFTALPLLNGGVNALLNLVPQDFDPADTDGDGNADALTYSLVRDENGNGLIDDTDTTAVGQKVPGPALAFAFTGGLMLAPAESKNFLLVLEVPDPPPETMTDAGGVLPLHAPVYAGGLLLALMGLLRIRGLRRRAQWLLLVLIATVGLAACSQGDDAPPPDPFFFGEPALSGDLRFKMVQLTPAASMPDQIPIGDGLPVFGPGILVQGLSL